jgi:hypothetical protein
MEEEEPETINVTVIHEQKDGTQTSKCVVVPHSIEWMEILEQATSLTTAEMAAVTITPSGEPHYLLHPYISLEEFIEDEGTPDISITVRPATEEEQQVMQRLKDAQHEFEVAEERLLSAECDFGNLRQKKRSRKE